VVEVGQRRFNKSKCNEHKQTITDFKMHRLPAMAQVEHKHSASAVKATARKRLRKLPPLAQLL